MLFDHRLRRVCLRVALAAALCLVGCTSLQAQTTSASVAGSVKDAQGGVLPGATVTLTSDTQGTVQTVVADGLGNFLFPYVRPDTYTLKISLQGFQSAERKGLVVNANDRIGTGAVTLEVGQITESILVEGRSQDIQLRSGERGFTLQTQALQNIAVNGRSFFGLVGLVPGIVPGPTQGGGISEQVTQVSNFSANGARSNSNNMTIDGVANIDTGDNGGNMAQTNLDAVAEFKVLTSGYQAEYGRAVGAQVQVVTKSGSRDFSGSAYWYARRSQWNENTWFNIRSKTAMAQSARNEAGFTVGGPVYIPGLFNKNKNKLFFFIQPGVPAQEGPGRRDARHGAHLA